MRATYILGGLGAILLIIVLVFAVWVWTLDSVDKDRIANNAVVARELAMTFGTRLQNVSLTAPTAQVRDAVRAQYADLIAPELLIAWTEDPTEAPGRSVSSPWPARIEVSNVQPLDADAYLVSGNIIFVTSADSAGEPAGTEPVWLTVERRGSVWLIADYTTEQPVVTWSSYTNETPHFSLLYPNAFEQRGGTPAGRDAGFWSELATSTGTTFITLTIPSSYQPETNFSEARVTVGWNDNVAACTDATSGATVEEEMTIGTETFAHLSRQDAGAGNRYEVDSYRIIRDGSCYAVETMLHYTALENHPASVAAFERGRIETLLADVVGTFSFE